MIPYFFDISNMIPFEVDDLTNVNKLQKVDRSQQPSYVKLLEVDIDVINQEFKTYIENKLDTKIKRVIYHQWFCPTNYVAHVDCNAEGERTLLAMNWVVNDCPTYVNFYDEERISGADGTVNSTANVGGHGEGWNYEAQPNLAYNVSNLRPNTTWSGRGPCLINTQIPHMVNACTPRRTISLRFEERIDLHEAIRRFMS